MVVLNELFEDVTLSERPLVRTLYDKHHMTTLAIGLKRGVVLPEHSTSSKAKLMVLEGEIDFNTATASYRLARFDSFDIPIDELHWVEAYSDAIFIVTKDK